MSAQGFEAVSPMVAVPHVCVGDRDPSARKGRGPLEDGGVEGVVELG